MPSIQRFLSRALPQGALLALTVAVAVPATARTFVLPHVLEKQGSVTSTPFTFDTTIFATYTPGLPGTGPGGGGGGGAAGGADNARRPSGATVEFFLYDDDGSPMQGGAGAGMPPRDVCNPCTMQLDAQNRKQSFHLDDLIVEAGGFDEVVKTGFGVLVVGGADPKGVNLQGFVVNSHSGPFDLSVFGFLPEEIRSTP